MIVRCDGEDVRGCYYGVYCNLFVGVIIMVFYINFLGVFEIYYDYVVEIGFLFLLVKVLC